MRASYSNKHEETTKKQAVGIHDGDLVIRLREVERRTWELSFAIAKKFFAKGAKAVKQHSTACAHFPNAFRSRFTLYDLQSASTFPLNSSGFTFSSSPSSFGISKFPHFSFRPLSASSRRDTAFK